MNKHAEYVGYEKKKVFLHSNSIVKKALQLRRHGRTRDVFKKETVVEINQLLGMPGTSIIFCDGGNKHREFVQFAPGLKMMDYIAVHDWGTEVREEQLQPTIDKYNLLPIASESWDTLKTYTRIWMKGE